ADRTLARAARTDRGRVLKLRWGRWIAAPRSPAPPRAARLMTDSPTAGSRSTSGQPSPRNPSSTLDLAWVLRPTEDDAGPEERMRRLRTHARLDPQAESQRLLRALRAIDLTSLAGDDTAERISALCHQAAAPVPPELAGNLATPAAELRTASVCVHHH